MRTLLARVAILLTLYSSAFAGNLVHLAPVNLNQGGNWTTYGSTLAPYINNGHGNSIILTLRWSQCDTGTTAPNYFPSGNACDALVLQYVTMANGGSCTSNCPGVIDLSFPIIGPPASGANTFTPTYIYNPTYCATVVGSTCTSTNLQYAVECNTAGQVYLGDSSFLNSAHYLGDGSGVTQAQLTTGFPATFMPVFVAARNAFAAAAMAHYVTLLGTQAGRQRFGVTGSNDEQHPFCFSYLETVPGGGGNQAGLFTAWQTTFQGAINADVAANTGGVTLSYAVNTFQSGDTAGACPSTPSSSQWMCMEAQIVYNKSLTLAAHKISFGFNGVNATDAQCWANKVFTAGLCTDWEDVFLSFPNINHTFQTTNQSSTNNGGVGISGAMNIYLPFAIQVVGSPTWALYYEPFPGDALCGLVSGYTDLNGCSNAGIYYSLYPALFTANLIQGGPASTSFASGNGQSSGKTLMQ